METPPFTPKGMTLYDVTYDLHLTDAYCVKGKCLELHGDEMTIPPAYQIDSVNYYVYSRYQQYTILSFKQGVQALTHQHFWKWLLYEVKTGKYRRRGEFFTLREIMEMRAVVR